MTTQLSSYDPNYFDDLAPIEETHFWFRTRNHIISSLIKQKVSGFPHGYQILEAGCGTGYVLRQLKNDCQRGHVTGVDLFMSGLLHARRRFAGSLVQANISTLPFAAVFNLICLFDVLEHMDDDISILYLLKRVLKNNGWLFITVPAFPSLWSYFDEAACHKRRYLISDLEEKVSAAGFDVEFSSYFMTTIFPPLWVIRRMLQGRSSGQDIDIHNQVSGELKLPGYLNNLMYWAMSWEIWSLERKLKLPFGTSLVVIARKMGD